MNETTSKQLTAMPTHEVAAPVDDVARIEAIVAQLERRTMLMERIHQTILSRMNPEVDMVVVGDSPRPTRSFAVLAFRLIGGTFEYLRGADGAPLVRRIDYEDSEGRYYVYEAFGRYTPPFGGAVEASGSCSSRHPFFGMRNREFVPVEDVREEHIRQMALTETFKKAVFTGLGLRQFTEEELESRANVDTTKAQRHDFAKGTQSAKAADSGDEAAMRASIRALLKVACDAGLKLNGREFGAGDEGALLKAVTEGSYMKDGREVQFAGYDSVDRVSAKALGVVYKKVKGATGADE